MSVELKALYYNKDIYSGFLVNFLEIVFLYGFIFFQLHSTLLFPLPSIFPCVSPWFNAVLVPNAIFSY